MNPTRAYGISIFGHGPDEYPEASLMCAYQMALFRLLEPLPKQGITHYNVGLSPGLEMDIAEHLESISAMHPDMILTFHATPLPKPKRSAILGNITTAQAVYRGVVPSKRYADIESRNRAMLKESDVALWLGVRVPDPLRAMAAQYHVPLTQVDPMRTNAFSMLPRLLDMELPPLKQVVKLSASAAHRTAGTTFRRGIFGIVIEK